MAVLRLPKGRCDHIKLIEAVHACGLHQQLPPAITLVIDSGHLSCGALAMLTAWGLRCRAAGTRFSLSPSARGADLGYPARMDLFRHLDIAFEETFERHEPGARFLPLLAVGPGGLPMSDAVDQLLRLIEGHFHGVERFLPALSWIAQELVDNIANHAQSNTPGVICAQFFPSKRQLDIAIWDAGVGLFESLRPAYPKLISDGDAISKALEAGVTRDPSIGQGNGLAGSRQLVAANGGQFQLWSGNATLILDQGKSAFKLSAGGQTLPGTGLLLSLRTDRPLDLTKLSLTSTQRFLRTGGSSSARLLRLAEEDTRGGRAAARALRQRLLTQLRASAVPLTVDFQDVPPLAHSFLDELFGRMVSELGGYQPFLEQVQLDHADNWTLDVLHHVLIQRHGLPERAVADPGQALPQTLRANLALICAPATVALWGPSADLPLTQETVRALWPQAAHLAQAQTEGSAAGAWLESLGAAPRPLLLVPSFKLDRLLVEAAQALAGVGPFFALAPPYVLSLRESPLRACLFAADQLRSLAILPWPGAGPLPFAKLALIGMGPLRQREAPHSLAFLDGELLGGQQPRRPQELTCLLDVHPCNSPFGYRFSLPSGEHQLDYAQDHPDQRKKDQDIQAHLGLVPLAELLVFARDGVSAHSLEAQGSGPHAIGGRELVAAQQLSREAFPRLGADQAAELEPIAVGDILFKAIGGGLALVADAKLVGMVPAYGVVHLRPRRAELAATLAEFLQSDWFTAKLFKARLMASAAELLADSVPDPASAPVQKLIRLASFSEELHRIADDFDRARRNLLVDDLGQQLQRLSEIQLLAEVIAESSAAYRDFGRQVELFYPQPLAEAWRKLGLQRSIEGRWEALFLALETAVQYTACAALAGYRQQGERLAILPQLMGKLTSTGATLGEWTEVLAQCKRDGSLRAFAELERLLVDGRERSPWWMAMREMRALRNEKSHHRGPRTGLDYEGGCAQAERQLETIYRGLSFFSRNRLIEVVSCQLDPLTEERTAQVRELVGDHPDVKFKQRPLDRELGAGLYLEDDQGGLHLVSPWLIYQECPHHHKYEIFNPERLDGDHLHYKGVYCGKLLSQPKDQLARLKKFLGQH